MSCGMVRLYFADSVITEWYTPLVSKPANMPAFDRSDITTTINILLLEGMERKEYCQKWEMQKETLLKIIIIIHIIQS